MRLKLTRPLAFFDLETTGTKWETDRIVEVAVSKRMPDGETITRSRLINPEVPIPPDATRVHRITDEMVKGQPRFKDIARSLADFLDGCDLGGYNVVRFDIPLLVAEFTRAQVEFSIADRQVVDAFQIFRKRESRKLADAVRFYLGRDHDGHRAEADTRAALDVLDGQMGRYDDLPDTVAALAEYCGWHPDHFDPSEFTRWDADQQCLVFTKGKHANTPVARVDEGFIHWMYGKDFLPETLGVVTREWSKHHVPSRPFGHRPTADCREAGPDPIRT